MDGGGRRDRSLRGGAPSRQALLTCVATTSTEKHEEYFERAFHFLVADLGYRDIGRLSATLPDVRDQVWEIRVNGERIGGYFYGSAEEISSRAAWLAKRLST